jgi:hypothetical protein
MIPVKHKKQQKAKTLPVAFCVIRKESILGDTANWMILKYLQE